MKIYEFEGFPNPARVRIALAEKGITDAVEFVSVDVPNGEHRTSGFLAKNPNGAVPVLELDDGTAISECTAITEYIDHAYDGIKLTGNSPKRRALIHMMQRRAEQDLLDAVSAYFHNATAGLGPDIETYQNRDWGLKQRERAVASIRYFDGVLVESPFIAGDEFSMADITVYAGLKFAEFVDIPIPKEFSNLIAWRARMVARKSIAA